MFSLAAPKIDVASWSKSRLRGSYWMYVLIKISTPKETKALTLFITHPRFNTYRERLFLWRKGKVDSQLIEK